MATIDLGKIKLVWRGTYAGGTDYTVDDVVQHTDGGITSSFICTTNSTGNAPSTGGSVHGSWAYLAKGSGDATLTTQGDVLYYGGSGLARLGAGTSGQFLKTQGGSANPIWANVPASGVIKSYFVTDGTRFSITSGGSGVTQQVGALTITTQAPASTSSKFLLLSSFVVGHENYGSQMTFMRGSTDLSVALASSPSNRTPGFFSAYAASADYTTSGNMTYIDSPNTASAVTYKVGTYVRPGGNTWSFNTNRNNQDTNDHISGVSTFAVLELGV
jgi:hypothetical protein